MIVEGTQMRRKPGAPATGTPALAVTRKTTETPGCKLNPSIRAAQHCRVKSGLNKQNEAVKCSFPDGDALSSMARPFPEDMRNGLAVGAVDAALTSARELITGIGKLIQV